ncbi:hypothetical protein DXT99_00835 [Pontibacter diazotrophicus]|uniref:Uncharacterized protein n=1 Tax=Pontibacter diazotrophicus TaxID=1400979 RepID=A0A3D8LIN4_9BACT|nr:hypothetical protein [Pontibacter diazotrophicus]RDV17094.1 hypothetical protein DXT99_00835 [Pontibacter diazotrophicus]
MKAGKSPRLWLLCALLFLLLPSCEEVFEEDVNYSYRIQNNTASTVQVTVQVKQNPSTIIKGDGKFYYTIAPGSTETIYNTSGFANESVFDEEKGDTELYWFTVEASKNGNAYKINFNDTRRWVYQKKNTSNATYTLSITEDDY